MKALLVIAALSSASLSLVLSLVCGGALAAAVEAPTASLTCVACHGPKGISANPLWPNIAGQKPDYLTKQLSDFREGRRADPLMTAIAMSLSPDDIRAVVSYFSSL